MNPPELVQSQRDEMFIEIEAEKDIPAPEERNVPISEAKCSAPPELVSFKGISGSINISSLRD